MKKVGILSMHRIYNYGSFLQGYSLKKMIESLEDDIEVSFIDYKPGEVLVKESADSSSKLRRVLDKISEYNEVDARLRDKIRFFNHKRTYAKRFFPLLGLPPEPNYDTEVDVEIIGSDEVFNAVQANTRVGYSRDLFGYGSDAKSVISYAGSFGNTTIEKIEAFGIKDSMKNDFEHFEAISVRDRNSQNIIHKLIGKDPAVNVDPALAYDLMGLEDAIPKNRQYNEKYIIAYGYSGRLSSRENEAVRKYAKSIGAKILCFGGVQECCDEFIDCNPFELLAFFRDAEAIITDTFHGTIFSIINNRPFGTLIRQSTGLKYGNEEKLSYLLEIFGLSAKKVNEPGEIEKVLAEKTDWDNVNSILTAERKKSREYLRKYL